MYFNIFIQQLGFNYGLGDFTKEREGNEGKKSEKESKKNDIVQLEVVEGN